MLRQNLVLVLLCAVFTSASANEASSSGLNSLKDWSRLCASADYDQQACLTRLMRQKGRGGEGFTAKSAHESVLMTRSGVMLSAAAHKMIGNVLTDTGKETVVNMKNGAQCLTYSVHRDQIDSPDQEAVYHSFTRFVTEQQSASAVMRHQTSIAGKQIYRFEHGEGEMVGAYIVDVSANAGIWMGCQKASLTALHEAANNLLPMIIGSARIY